jgi:hypothetical protein
MYKKTAKRAAALRKAQRASARKRKGRKSKDYLGWWIRKGITSSANALTAGKATRISDAIEGKKAVNRRRYVKYKRV